MIDDLTLKQQKLAKIMGDISEECYSAGWYRGLECVQWHAVINGERKFGQGIVTQKEIIKLKLASEVCNAWIYFDEQFKETAIDLDVWKKKFTDFASTTDLLRY